MKKPAEGLSLCRQFERVSSGPFQRFSTSRLLPMHHFMAPSCYCAVWPSACPALMGLNVKGQAVALSVLLCHFGKKSGLFSFRTSHVHVHACAHMQAHMAADTGTGIDAHTQVQTQTRTRMHAQTHMRRPTHRQH